MKIFRFQYALLWFWHNGKQFQWKQNLNVSYVSVLTSSICKYASSSPSHWILIVKSAQKHPILTNKYAKHLSISMNVCMCMFGSCYLRKFAAFMDICCFLNGSPFLLGHKLNTDYRGHFACSTCGLAFTITLNLVLFGCEHVFWEYQSI